MTPRVVAVVGPTASGKTGLGIAIAQAIGAEVVNADSMQLYAGMDVGTAKASLEERAGVIHHLLDVWSPVREASVADYQQLARDSVEGILARGVNAVIVGGSGLYVRAVLDNLEFPGVDLEVRARLYAELDELGPEVLHARLAQLDPAAAAANSPQNGRRIVRALEVIEITGQPFSATLPTYGTERWGATQIGLDPPLPLLDARIEARVAHMWDAGLVAETLGLRDGVGLGPTARRALGYAQVLSWQGGELSTEQAAREATAAATRRYSRRQRSWFRRDPRIRWFATAPTVSDLGLTPLAQ